jgi:hypothetical protein
VEKLDGASRFTTAAEVAVPPGVPDEEGSRGLATAAFLNTREYVCSDPRHHDNSFLFSYATRGTRLALEDGQERR